MAAVQYRRDGRLGPRDLMVLLSGAIYGLALWTYTLLPMPVDGDYTCVGRQTTPFGTIGEIAWRDAGTREGLAALARDPAFLQVALNVLLFVPLGYFVRRVLRRGVLVATVLGLGTSLLIETTQATGVWHLYSCAYRLLDVDDLILNTLGATVGSLAAAVVVRRKRPEVVWPTSLTAGRRLVGMVCDVLFVLLLGSALAVTYRGVQALPARRAPRGPGDHPATPAAVGRPGPGGGAGRAARGPHDRRVGRRGAAGGPGAPGTAGAGGQGC
ncbi:hypothetical protein G5V59_16230 [Nocardioides sp. W3-2-3]|uniref:VanZ family protein n=1 Tax=Nocardioides convexus TaxID=2712224 RepID=UPI0024186961|nr:VanZ family protein [Nocardioides convexus]NHA00935.1 hypothetical protein [Nocardioides convexus]